MSSFFSEEFFAKLSGNPVIALKQICEKFIVATENTSVADYHEWHPELLETVALLQVYAQANGLRFEFPEVVGDRYQDAKVLGKFVHDLHSTASAAVSKGEFASLKSRFGERFKTVFAYEFSQGDLDRIQFLIGELRTTIQNSTEVEENYRARLLKRVEQLQQELHKRMSNLDRFWGVVGEAGVILGKFGKDAKPLVDRIREIAEIIWRAQSRAEELPSTTKPPIALPGGDDLEGGSGS